MLSTQLRILIYPVTLCHVEYTPFIHVFSWSVMFCFCHIWLHLVPCTVNFSQLIRICCPHFWLHLGLYRPPSQALLEKSSPSIIPLFKVHSKRMISMLEILFWNEMSGGMPCSGPLVGFLSIYYKETKLTLKLEKCFSLTRGKTGCCWTSRESWY